MKILYESVFLIWKNVFNYRGTLGRKEYWVGLLVLTVLSTSIFFGGIPLVESSIDTAFLVSLFVFSFVVFNNLSLLSAHVRRFRDAGYSPWLVLLFLLPLGFIPAFFFLAKPSK